MALGSVALQALTKKTALALLADSPHASVVLDRAGTILYCNDAVLELLYQSREALVGRGLDAIVEFESGGSEWDALISGQIWSGDVWAICADGVRIPLYVSRSPIFDDSGEVVGVLSQAAVRSAEAEARAVLQESEERFRALVTHSSDIAVVFDSAGRITFVTPSIEAVSGHSVAELIGTSFWDYLHADDLASAQEQLAEMSAAGTETGERRLRHADGSYGWYEFSLTNLTENPAVRGTVGNFRDVTARHAADAALRHSERRFRRVVELSSDAFLSLDSDDRITSWNQAAEAMFGWSPAEGAARELADLLVPEDRLTGRRLFDRAPSGAAGARLDPVFEIEVVSATGHRFPVEVSVVQDSTPGESQFQAFFRDITARKAEEARLTRQALTDPLTGLANRSLLTDRLGRAVARLARREGTMAVLFVDIDGFKLVNDGLGHEAGDKLLTSIGERITHAIRAIDTVARYGGDEFVVVAEDIRLPDEPKSIAERIIAAVGLPITIGGREIRPSISVGIVSTDSGARSAEDLLRDADVAMYKAKELGGGCFVVFDEAMGARARGRLELEEELRRAIKGGELVLHYQPIVTLSGQIRSVEALVRWQHPRLGLVAPMEFIPLAEETGLVVALGAWVLEEACRQAASWRATVSPGLELSVNVASGQLSDPGLPALVKDVLDRTGMAPEALCLEITESALLLEPDAAAVSLRALREIGVKVAVDDFGTGYSSLLYLKRFPVQILKLDRFFVAGISHNHADAAVAASVVRLAESLGLQAVAEGVETVEQRAILEDLGCEQAQGFLWSPAQTAEAMSRLLESGPVRPSIGEESDPAWPPLEHL